MRLSASCEPVPFQNTEHFKTPFSTFQNIGVREHFKMPRFVNKEHGVREQSLARISGRKCALLTTLATSLCG
jgi:cobalamin biosynthesis protein CbiG